MARRKNAAPPAPSGTAAEDDYETQADREVDEELDEVLGLGDDEDDGGFWDDEDERSGDLSDGDEDDAPSPGADADDDEEDLECATEETPVASVEDEFGSFAIAKLPAKMRTRPLADQSNQWLTSTIGRLVEQISAALPDEDADDEDIVDLELDLLKLYRAAAVRGIDAQLSEETHSFIAGIGDKHDAEGRGADDQAEPPTTDHSAAAASLAITYVRHGSVHPDPLQPRQHADVELRDSIRSLGILQPLTVRRVRLSELVDRAEPCAHCATPWTTIGHAGGWVIVDGERRWNGADGVMNMVPVIVREDQGDEYERLKTQLVSNTGKPLTPIEEARTFARMLKDRDVTVAQLARDIGRPPSTVHDRVKLLELGPWLPLIEQGTISISMAVECLVPLRGVPDEYHAEAIAKMMDGLEPGDQIAETIDQFSRSVADAYKRYMYPLVKSKQPYEKQPEFSTKSHDTECGCGGIAWSDWGGPTTDARKYCGNPDWWKPLHKEALKKKREKEAESGTPSKNGKGPTLRLELPDGVKTVGNGYNTPPGVISLTNYDGKWQVSDRRSLDEAFDPDDLVIDEKKLVRIKSSSGVDLVGTRDSAAVKAAREKWQARFAPAAASAGKKLLASFEKLEEVYGLSGAGVHQLLRSFDINDLDLVEIARLLEIECPKQMGEYDSRRAERSKHRDDWVTKTLKRKDAERIASFMMFLSADEKRHLPSKAIEDDQLAAVDAIQKKRAPWVTTKALAKAAKKKGGAK